MSVLGGVLPASCSYGPAYHLTLGLSTLAWNLELQFWSWPLASEHGVWNWLWYWNSNFGFWHWFLLLGLWLWPWALGWLWLRTLVLPLEPCLCSCPPDLSTRILTLTSNLGCLSWTLTLVLTPDQGHWLWPLGMTAQAPVMTHTVSNKRMCLKGTNEPYTLCNCVEWLSTKLSWQGEGVNWLN